MIPKERVWLFGTPAWSPCSAWPPCTTWPPRQMEKKLIQQEWGTKFHLHKKQRPYSSRFWGTKSFVSPDRTTYKMFIKEIALINLIRPKRGGVFWDPHLKFIWEQYGMTTHCSRKLVRPPPPPPRTRNPLLTGMFQFPSFNETVTCSLIDKCKFLYRLWLFLCQFWWNTELLYK